MEDKNKFTFVGFSILFLVALIFAIYAIDYVSDTAENIDSIGLSDSATLNFIALATTQTLSPIGEGITSASVKVYNNTWLDFDGGNDYVRINATNQINKTVKEKNITLSMWVKFNDLTQEDQNIACFYYNNTEKHYIRRLVDGEVRAYQWINNTGDGSSSSIYLNESDWYHIAWTIQGTSNKIYINGDYKEDLVLAHPLSPIQGNVRILLGTQSGSDQFLNGSINDVRVYDFVLDENDIYYIYSGGMT